MFRSCSRDDLRTGSAAFLSWPSTLSSRLMRLFEHLRFKDAGPHTLSTAAKLQPLRPPVSWASAHYRLRRCNHKSGAWKMHANLADLAITASDHDLMDVRGDQFTDNRIASSIVRRDGNGLARFSTVGILGIDRRRGDRCGISCDIKRLLRAHLASAAMADSRNALSPGLEPRKAVERRRRRPEILPQVPSRMIGGEIGEASGGALQKRGPRSPRLVQPSGKGAPLVKKGWDRPPHFDRDRNLARGI